MRKLVMTIFGLSLIAGANAFVWVESGDAPEFVGGNTAQLVIGSGGLTEIQGMFHSGAPDADSYVIQITQPVSFEATTVGGTTADTQLFLFRLDGMGVLHNDDGAVTGDSLRSRIGVNGGPVMPANVSWTTWASGNLPAGLYVISVSQWDRDPFAGTDQIWNDTPFNQQRTPDGPGAGSPVNAWSGGPSGNGITYSIFFQGADGVPEPATMLAIGAGLAALAARRRRK